MFHNMYKYRYYSHHLLPLIHAITRETMVMTEYTVHSQEIVSCSHNG